MHFRDKMTVKRNERVKRMQIPALSVDPSGLWSLTQAKRVLAIINPEAEARGICFKAIDVTHFGMPHPRVMLIAYCLTHDCIVEFDRFEGVFCAPCDFGGAISRALHFGALLHNL